MNPVNASQSTECGLVWKRYSRQTPLHDVVPALNGRASLARVRPCRTGAASFMVARARGRGRRRAWSVAGEQTGSTATTLAKRRRNGRACGRQSLRSAICATQSKGTRGPALGYGSRVRIVRSAMVAGRVGHRPATRPQGEERLAECPPDAGRRDTRAAASAARPGAVLAQAIDKHFSFELCR
jgi:hypothetical protein